MIQRSQNLGHLTLIVPYSTVLIAFLILTVFFIWLKWERFLCIRNRWSFSVERRASSWGKFWILFGLLFLFWTIFFHLESSCRSGHCCYNIQKAHILIFLFTIGACYLHRYLSICEEHTFCFDLQSYIQDIGNSCIFNSCSYAALQKSHRHIYSRNWFALFTHVRDIWKNLNKN